MKNNKFDDKFYVGRDYVWYSPELDELITMREGPKKGYKNSPYTLSIDNLLTITRVFFIGKLN